MKRLLNKIYRWLWEDSGCTIITQEEMNKFIDELFHKYELDKS